MAEYLLEYKFPTLDDSTGIERIVRKKKIVVLRARDDKMAMQLAKQYVLMRGLSYHENKYSAEIIRLMKGIVIYEVSQPNAKAD